MPKQLMSFDDRPQRAPKGIRTRVIEQQAIKVELTQPKKRWNPHWLIKGVIINACLSPFGMFSIIGFVPMFVAWLLWLAGYVELTKGKAPTFSDRIADSVDGVFLRREQRAEQRERDKEAAARRLEAEKLEQARIERERLEAIAKEEDDKERASLCAEAMTFNIILDPKMTTLTMRDAVDRVKAAKADKALRESLYARAKGMGVPYRETATTERLKSGLDEAERAIKRHNAAVANYEAAHAKWEAIPYNSACPYCGRPFRTRAQPKTTLKCPMMRCQAVFSARTSYARFKLPPEPQPPAPLQFVEIL